MKRTPSFVNCIVLVGAALFAGLGCGRSTEERKSSTAEGREWSRRFVDVSARSGITFHHETGAQGKKLLPEALGAGVAFLDFNGDGNLDLFFVNGVASRQNAAPTRCALYRGRGDGTFEDVGAQSGADIVANGMGVAVADVDGDGDDDLAVSAVDGLFFLRNDGGKFVECAKERGLDTNVWTDASGVAHPAWATALAFVDVDGDRDADLFVGNYVRWTPETDIFTTIDGRTKAFTTPDRYRGLPCRLYLNDGQGRFADASERFGLLPHEGKALGIAVWDFNGDHRPDIVVANDTRPNFLFMNRDGKHFDETATDQEIAYDEHGRARAGMGIDVSEYAGDGVPGIAIGNFAGEPISLYRRADPHRFQSVAERAGLAEATIPTLTFGLVFADLDLDGFDDLALANGHIEPDIERLFRGQRRAQPMQIFQNDGRGGFRDVSVASGADVVVPRVGRGLAVGDFDGDGDLDLVMTTSGDRPVLFRNDPENGAPAAHFLRVKVRSTRGTTIGTEVRATWGGHVTTRVVHTGSSYLSQSEAVLTFGLGSALNVDRLDVRWPDGRLTQVLRPAIDRSLEIIEPPQ